MYDWQTEHMAEIENLDFHSNESHWELVTSNHMKASLVHKIPLNLVNKQNSSNGLLTGLFVIRTIDKGRLKNSENGNWKCACES